MQSTKGLKAVCMFDPAVAAAVPQDELIAYARSRKYDDIKHYIKKGSEPPFYHYRLLSRSVMDRFVDTQPSDEGKAVAAFQYGLTRVDMKRENDGVRVNWAPTGKTGTPDGEIPTLTDREMGPDVFSRIEQVEIGTVIYNASNLPQWIERGYPVPGSSLSLWARVAPPSVGASQSTAPQSNTKPSASGSPTPEATGPAPAPSAPESGKVTVVPAAGSNQ